MNWNPFNLVQKKSDAPLSNENPALSGTAGTYTDPITEALTPAQLRAYYIKNAWVRKYINTLVNGCLKYELKAVPKDGTKNPKAAETHAEQVNAKLKIANEAESFIEVRSKYLRDLFLYGNGALEIAGSGEDIALHAATGYILRAKFDENGNLAKSGAYAFLDPISGDETGKKFDASEIVHFKLDALSDKFYGNSPLDASVNELSCDTQATKEMARGDFGVPPLLVSAPGQPNGFISKFIADIQRMLLRKAGNKFVVHTVANAKVEKLCDKTFANEFEFQKWLVQRHNIYGIPPFKLGFVSEVGSMSAKEQREEFAVVIETFVAYECAKLTLVLCQLNLEFDDIEIVAPNLVTRLDFEKSRVVSKLVDSGLITPNEARIRYFGLPANKDKAADQLRQPKSAG